MQFHSFIISALVAVQQPAPSPAFSLLEKLPPVHIAEKDGCLWQPVWIFFSWGRGSGAMQTYIPCLCLEYNDDSSVASPIIFTKNELMIYFNIILPPQGVLPSFPSLQFLQLKHIIHFSSRLCVSSFSARHTILNLIPHHYYFPPPLCPNILPNNFLFQKHVEAIFIKLERFLRSPEKKRKKLYFFTFTFSMIFKILLTNCEVLTCTT